MESARAQWITPKVRRVLAPNPSPMTASGTNSYLLGRGGALALIDPGPDLDMHETALLAALDKGESIGAILVTHAHLDHSALAPRLSQRTGAPVYGFGPARAGQSERMKRLVSDGLAGGGEGVDHSFAPDITLADGAELSGDWGKITALHTPGHMGGHMAFAQDGVLFSGDHAMGWASSLISPPDGDMRDYMESLRRLIPVDWALMLPAHGAEVRHVRERLTALLDHRLAREAQLREALTQGPASAQSLAARLYTESPPALLPAAAQNMLAHLIDLMDRSQVHALSDPAQPLGPATLFDLRK